MALSWRTAVTGTNGSSVPNVAVSLTGFSTGDLMLVAISCASGAGSVTPPAGWTELEDVVVSGWSWGAAYYRLKDGSEGSTATFTFGSSVAYAYVATAAAGPLTVSAATSGATTNHTSGATAMSFAAIPAPGTTGYLGVAFACARSAVGGTHSVTTVPTGWTNVADLGPTSQAFHPVIFAKENISSAGETPTGGVWNDNHVEANVVVGILAAPAAVTPVADFTGTPLTGVAPLSVTFTDASTNTPTSWAWTFGDAGTSTSQNPTHSYTSAGTYTVVLVATNSAGSNTKTRTAYVTVAAGFVPQIIMVN